MKRLKVTNIYRLVVTKSDREFFQVAFAVFAGWAAFSSTQFVFTEQILVLRASNFQGATIRPIVSRHKHSIVLMVHH